ncbi:hypothetical protein NDU88_009202 [Pleurodeles waltl]|uniref:Secreted protein n=1 Tax=Pleurodeles waltl TaxID=8319 RepID=A0AAV7QSB4_PLEWA|nr:hypothetical protein NDU88_009202 [Pleurodeles waltl]
MFQHWRRRLFLSRAIFFSSIRVASPRGRGQATKHGGCELLELRAASGQTSFPDGVRGYTTSYISYPEAENTPGPPRLKAVSRRPPLVDLRRNCVGRTRQPGREAVIVREEEQPARLEPHAGIKILLDPPHQSTCTTW